METVHAVFETGHAEGSGQKQVRLLEKNAIAILPDRPDIRQKVDGWNEGASRKSSRLKPEATRMIGLGTDGKQVLHERASAWKSGNRWKEGPDAGASAGDVSSDLVGGETSGAKCSSEGSPEE